jgi:hypothetical protein
MMRNEVATHTINGEEKKKNVKFRLRNLKYLLAVLAFTLLGIAAPWMDSIEGSLVPMEWTEESAKPKQLNLTWTTRNESSSLDWRPWSSSNSTKKNTTDEPTTTVVGPQNSSSSFEEEVKSSSTTQSNNNTPTTISDEIPSLNQSSLTSNYPVAPSKNDSDDSSIPGEKKMFFSNAANQSFSVNTSTVNSNGTLLHSTFKQLLLRRAIAQTTKILYKDASPEELNFWLSQPPPRVYVYDNLSEDWSSPSNVSKCVDEMFLGNNTQEWNQHNCLWELKVCMDKQLSHHSKGKKCMAHRYNYVGDVAFIERFLTYDYRVYDPNQADLFVVPYPHKSHCLCHMDFRIYSSRCSLGFDQIKTHVLDKLTYFNESTDKRSRHLFFYGADFKQALTPFHTATAHSMSFSLGPVEECRNASRLCGHYSVPYISTEPDFQPAAVQNYKPDGWWTTTRE